MFCKYCGHELDENAEVCMHCGCPTDNFGRRRTNIVTSPAEPAHKTNPYAVTGLVLAIVGAVCILPSTIFGAIVLILAIVFSSIGIAKAKDIQRGRGMAIAALVIAIVVLVAGIALRIVLAYLGLNLAGYLVYLLFAATM